MGFITSSKFSFSLEETSTLDSPKPTVSIHVSYLPKISVSAFDSKYVKL